MDEDAIIRNTLARYPRRWVVQRWESLGAAGGFSGARFWRIDTDERPLCLRRWPSKEPSRSRLEYIHAALLQGKVAGLTFLPVPYQCRERNSVVQVNGACWELSDWLPGVADFHDMPSDERLTAAMQALAQLHVATGRSPPANGPAPSLVRRLEQLHRLQAGGFDQLSAGLDQVRWAEFQDRGRDVLRLSRGRAREVAAQLQQTMLLPVPLQPAIRDIWHDHVLFVGDAVTGIVDFGAMRQESIAADLSRLLGSLVGDDQPRRALGLAAYEQLRPLSANEQKLIEIFDCSAVLLSGLNWIQWIAVDGRVFEEPARVLKRMDEWLGRLERRVGL